MKTFREFQATREECADLGARMGADYFEKSPRAGYLYAGSCYIEREPDGTFYLLLHRAEYRSPELEKLEAILYSWAITEFPEEFDMPDDVHRFLCELQRFGDDKFATAMLANLNDPDPLNCHMHDFCDANQCALDALGEDVTDDSTDEDAQAIIARAFDIYERARPYLRGKED
jgi:hypothetical protein